MENGKFKKIKFLVQFKKNSFKYPINNYYRNENKHRQQYFYYQDVAYFTFLFS